MSATDRSEPETPMLRPSRDRRDTTARAALRDRIHREFRELPGLCVTALQAAPRFDLTEEICARVLDELVERGLIQKLKQSYGAFRTVFVGCFFVDAIRPVTTSAQKPRAIGILDRVP